MTGGGLVIFDIISASEPFRQAPHFILGGRIVVE
jgi:hypothetical protein